MTVTLQDLKHLEIMAKLEERPIPSPELQESPVKTASTSLTEKLLLLASKLRESGYTKQAENLENTFVMYKKAESIDPALLYRAHSETGDDLLEFAHPDGDVEVAPAQDHLGDVETPISQHKKILDVVQKKSEQIKKAEIISILKESLNIKVAKKPSAEEGIAKSLFDKTPVGYAASLWAQYKNYHNQEDLAEMLNVLNTQLNNILGDLSAKEKINISNSQKKIQQTITNIISNRQKLDLIIESGTLESKTDSDIKAIINAGIEINKDIANTLKEADFIYNILSETTSIGFFSRNIINESYVAAKSSVANFIKSLQINQSYINSYIESLKSVKPKEVESAELSKNLEDKYLADIAKLNELIIASKNKPTTDALGKIKTNLTNAMAQYKALPESDKQNQSTIFKYVQFKETQMEAVRAKFQ